MFKKKSVLVRILCTNGVLGWTMIFRRLTSRIKIWHYFIWTFIILFIVYWNYTNQYKTLLFYEPPEQNVSCYNVTESTLQNIDEKFEASNNTFFFLETSCKGGLNSRQACAVESAAIANPNWRVVVLFTGPLCSGFIRGASFRKLSSIPNVQFRKLDVFEFTKGSPFHPIFSKGIIFDSTYPVVHTSDLLRLLVLYKFGGVYLDLDMIVMKSFNPLPLNFITTQSKHLPASGILRFSKDPVGRNFARLAISDLAANFTPYKWSPNGPRMIERILTKVCVTSYVPEMTAITCQGMHVLPWTLFFPISYPFWHTYFEDLPPKATEAYTHHVWNAFGNKERIPRESMFARLAALYCPKTYQLYGDQFGF